MTMIAALVALAFGASAGIFLASRHFLKKRMPAWIALLHGIGGATGFALVLLTVVREPTFRPIRDVLYLLIATVVLGVVNLLFHIRKVRHRTSLILMHGLTAVTAASMLIRAILVHVEPSASATPAPPPSGSSGATASATPSATTPAPAPTPIPIPAKDELVLDEATQKALERPVTFERKSTELSRGSHARIVEVAAALKSRPEITLVEVQGHADERGDDGKNIELTLARAAVVVNALVENGVGRARLHSAGYGARCPADPECRGTNAPESCHETVAWERDRRVVFLVLQVRKASFTGEVACTRGVELIPPADRRFHGAAGSTAP